MQILNCIGGWHPNPCIVQRSTVFFFFFFLLFCNCRGSIYILGINPFSDILFTIIFSQFIAYLFTFYIVYFLAEML